MNYRTVEVDLENGRVHPSGDETLPEKAHALLTIISPDRDAVPPSDISLADLMADSCGIGNGQHADLSTNKTHLDDLGK